MSYDSYKLIHVLGLTLVFLGLGGALLRSKDVEKPPGMSMMLHGIGLLVLLVAGFGLMARRNMEWPWELWIFLKLACWLFLGALPTLCKKGIVPRALGWVVAVGIAAAAVYLAIYKPA